MAMDIKQLQNQPRVNTGSVPKNTAQSSQTAQQGAAPQKADSVVVSQQAQQLQGVQSKMASLPEIDQKKITEIKLRSPKADIRLTRKNWQPTYLNSNQN